jgi:PIN domain nuclease of toxin-antitoxin system
VRFLLDTHILLWAALGSDDLPAAAAALISDGRNELYFSAASIWEVAIKAGKGFANFSAHPERLRRRLVATGYFELAVSGAHAAAVVGLPGLHKDPFDRLLVAQAALEQMVLLTGDDILSRYPGNICKV